jgi:hypothetical protein
MIKKLRIMFGWFFAGIFLLGSLTGIMLFFTEPDKFMGIGVAVTSLLVAYAFYIIGPGWEVVLEKRKLKAMKREQEEKRKADRLDKEKRKAEKKEEEKKRKADLLDKEKEKEEEEAKQKKEERKQKKLERRAKKEEQLRELCVDENEWKSFKKNKICVGMHILVVGDIKGTKHEEKRNVSANKTTLKYKYGQSRSRNQRGTWSYDLEVTFVDDRVTAFKDL